VENISAEISDNPGIYINCGLRLKSAQFQMIKCDIYLLSYIYKTDPLLVGSADKYVVRNLSTQHLQNWT